MTEPGPLLLSPKRLEAVSPARHRSSASNTPTRPSSSVATDSGGRQTPPHGTSLYKAPVPPPVLPSTADEPTEDSPPYSIHGPHSGRLSSSGDDASGVEGGRAGGRGQSLPEGHRYVHRPGEIHARGTTLSQADAASVCASEDSASLRGALVGAILGEEGCGRPEEVLLQQAMARSRRSGAGSRSSGLASMHSSHLQSGSASVGSRRRVQGAPQRGDEDDEEDEDEDGHGGHSRTAGDGRSSAGARSTLHMSDDIPTPLPRTQDMLRASVEHAYSRRNRTTLDYMATLNRLKARWDAPTAPGATSLVTGSHPGRARAGSDTSLGSGCDSSTVTSAATLPSACTAPARMVAAGSTAAALLLPLAPPPVPQHGQARRAARVASPSAESTRHAQEAGPSHTYDIILVGTAVLVPAQPTHLLSSLLPPTSPACALIVPVGSTVRWCAMSQAQCAQSGREAGYAMAEGSRASSSVVGEGRGGSLPISPARHSAAAREGAQVDVDGYYPCLVRQQSLAPDSPAGEDEPSLLPYSCLHVCTHSRGPYPRPGGLQQQEEEGVVHCPMGRCTTHTQYTFPTPGLYSFHEETYPRIMKACIGVVEARAWQAVVQGGGQEEGGGHAGPATKQAHLIQEASTPAAHSTLSPTSRLASSPALSTSTPQAALATMSPLAPGTQAGGRREGQEQEEEDVEESLSIRTKASARSKGSGTKGKGKGRSSGRGASGAGSTGRNGRQGEDNAAHGIQQQEDEQRTARRLSMSDTSSALPPAPVPRPAVLLSTLTTCPWKQYLHYRAAWVGSGKAWRDCPTPLVFHPLTVRTWSDGQVEVEGGKQGDTT